MTSQAKYEQLNEKLRTLADEKDDAVIAAWVRANATEHAAAWHEDRERVENLQRQVWNLEQDIEDVEFDPQSVRRLEDRLHADPGSSVQHDPLTAMLIFRASGRFTNPVPVIASSLQELGARA